MTPWMRELGIATLCGTAFALPGLIAQQVAGRALGPAADLMALLALGSSSRWHLVLQPLDAVLSAGARVVFVALLCHAVLVVLVGRRDWRPTLVALARASRVLAWAPLCALVLAAWAVGLVGEVESKPALAIQAMRGWLVVQGALLAWVLLRFARRLGDQQGVPAGVAWFVGLSPAWAPGGTWLIEAALR